MKLFDPPCRNTEICPPGKAVWNANGGFVSVLLTHLFTFISRINAFSLRGLPWSNRRSRRLHGGCTEATEHNTDARRRSLYGGDGSYTERLLRELTAKKLNMFNFWSQCFSRRRRITDDDGRPRRAWRISTVNYGGPWSGDPWFSVAHTVNV